MLEKKAKVKINRLYGLCVCVHVCLSAPAHTWPQVDSTPCPLPCASILTWMCCPTSIYDTCMKELGFTVPFSPQEDINGVTESFFVCRNQRN